MTSYDCKMNVNLSKTICNYWIDLEINDVIIDYYGRIIVITASKLFKKHKETEVQAEGQSTSKHTDVVIDLHYTQTVIGRVQL